MDMLHCGAEGCLTCRVPGCKLAFDTDRHTVIGSFKLTLKRCRDKPSSCHRYDLVKLCDDSLFTIPVCCGGAEPL